MIHRPDADQAVPPHAQPAGQVLAALASSPSGLAAAEAARRLAQDGPNSLPEPPRQSALRRLLLQFHNLLIYVLLASAAITLLLGHTVDAAVILGVVIANAAIGFVQEGKAEQALDSIRRMVAPRAAILRDGRRTTLPAEQVVRGDIVLLEAGDRVPADLRLIHASSLRIEEAPLTGESVPAEKSTAATPPDAPLGDRDGMAHSGCFVAAGQGRGVVVATGTDTELGRISTLLGSVERAQTPLIRQMDGFARRLTLIILAVCAAAFAFALLVRDYAVGDAFMAVIGLAVGAIPEGLPAVLTITLAIGVQRMVGRNAIIRHLPAVETLGAVSVICSDKTGTLTRNEMAARAIVTPTARYEATGQGYAPEGAIRHDGQPADPAADPALDRLLHAAALCNDAALREADGTWRVEGDPMEGALLALAARGGLDIRTLRRDHPRRDAIPFDSRQRYMATLHADGSVLLKGAPERLFALCARELHPGGLRPRDEAAWHETADRLAAEGQRVLAFATLPADPTRDAIDEEELADAILLGCVGLIDPPREEAAAAIAECREAGISVVMITGDHAATAGEIGRRIGLADSPRVVTGHDIDAWSDAHLQAEIRAIPVFARTSPEHKLRIVGALQAHGLTVAMTGDGVNDAPALKRADVGIAMGRKGTEAAKQAAQMVLADDNFASIVAAVREGRTVYDNLLKVIDWILPTSGGLSATILAALALGLPFPATPVQVLWINMVTAVALGLTLAFEHTEPGAMRRPPRPRDGAILTGDLAWRILFVSMLFLAGAFGVFYWAQSNGLPIETARTLVVNTIVAMEIAYLFSVRYTRGVALTWRGLLGTNAVLLGVAGVILAQLAVTYVPFLQSIFGTTSISPAEGAAVIAIGIALLVAVEAEKRIRRAFLRG
jgi:magnesium-transporting ATPase (P-type)